ncbi:MAG: hypothetical protein AAGI68_13985 [Planctomycetota bacterium]
MTARRVLTIAAIVVFAGLSWLGYNLYHFAYTTVPNAYAMWAAGDVLAEYLRQYDDQWPESWEDLRPVYQNVRPSSDPSAGFEDLKSRVAVRWDVDVEAIRQLPEPPRDLVVLQDGGSEHWSGAEPNEMIYRYLQSPPSETQPSTAAAME